MQILASNLKRRIILLHIIVAEKMLLRLHLISQENIACIFPLRTRISTRHNFHALGYFIFQTKKSYTEKNAYASPPKVHVSLCNVNIKVVEFFAFVSVVIVHHILHFSFCLLSQHQLI